MNRYVFLGILWLWAQQKPSLYGIRVGINWGQFLNQTVDMPKSRSYWLGGPLVGAIAHLPFSKYWAIQPELNARQHRGIDRNLLKNYQYDFWTLDLPLLLSFRHKQKLNLFFLETGPMVSLILGGRVETTDNLSGNEIRDRIGFGKKPGTDLRRGEISWAVGAAASYNMGPGYLALGLRFVQGINNVAGADFKKWNNYGVWMTISYLYDPTQKDE